MTSKKNIINLLSDLRYIVMVNGDFKEQSYSFIEVPEVHSPLHSDEELEIEFCVPERVLEDALVVPLLLRPALRSRAILLR